MKHSVLFKFIAILLCAVSLLGIVGSSFGILALTEWGLYNKTVDQMLEERIQSDGASVSHAIAARYASTQLGGASERLSSRIFPDHLSVFSGIYGYSILDAEGNVLSSLNPEYRQTGETYTFPASGQYIHVVSLMTEEEKYPAPTYDPQTQENAIWVDDLYIYENLPSEGAVITQVYFYAVNSGGFDYADPSGLGTAYYSLDGHITCLFTDMHDFFPINTTITNIVLVADGVPVYEASSPDGVGYFTYSGSNPLFVSTVYLEEPQPETVPETIAVTEPPTVPETIPETAPETIPETTAETIPETTEPEIQADIVNNLPEGRSAEVVEFTFILEDGEELNHRDDHGIGRIRQVDGMTLFTSYEYLDSPTGLITYAYFLDEEDEILFEVDCEEGFGELFYNEDDLLSYEAVLPVPVEEETVPETTAETVPETTMETVPPTEAETVPVTVPETAPAALAETEPQVTEPIVINGKPLKEYDLNTYEYYDYEYQQQMYATYVYTPMPEYTVELYLTEDSFQYTEMYQVLEIVRMYRNYLLPVLGVSILLFFLFGVYLVCAAGHRPKSDLVQAGGLNRTPLDLYLLILCLGIPMLCVVIQEGGDYLLRQNLMLGCAWAVGLAFAACLLAVAFLFALVAQCKTPDGFWWRNTLCGHAIRLFARFAVWLEKISAEKILPFLGKLLRKLWAFTCAALVWLYRNTEKLLLWTGHKLGRLLSWLGKLTHRFLSLLPLTWQWLAAGFLMFLLIAIVFATNGEEILMVLCLGACVALIVYGAHCFGILLDSTKKMRRGDLDTKVDDKMMVGSFKEFAGELNELAGVAVVAAQKQLKSERMKTELITNVSHDIKTPLTSIINYVDLLQKPHTEAEGEQYLEVLSRQSLQLKKLIEDLMDMSKASTGNMNVEITQVDAVESINQALGEFADKLDKARLVPVFRHTEPSVPMMADGRLVWRVLSNLLGNAVKYAMPGTRLYLDLMTLDDTVVISLKNISREELNMDADELMERFVRGDDSRNTEGSGLGLNIAKSLMELQKGQMQLLVDGDLFKVTLIFPGV